MINGIPCLFYYDKDNHEIPPDAMITGADISKVKDFKQYKK